MGNRGAKPEGHYTSVPAGIEDSGQGKPDLQMKVQLRLEFQFLPQFSQIKGFKGFEYSAFMWLPLGSRRKTFVSAELTFLKFEFVPHSIEAGLGQTNSGTIDGSSFQMIPWVIFMA